jgi:Tfp pilus assembly protein FimT
MKKSGFTLIEFVLVIVLLFIISAVAVPRLSIIQGVRVNAAVRSIVSDIRYAQSLAISTQKDHRVVFTSAGNSYTIEENDGGWQSIARPTMSGSFTVQLNTDYEGVVIDNSYSVQFNSFGEPVAGGGGSFSVSYNGSLPQRTITIQSNTGRTTVN